MDYYSKNKNIIILVCIIVIVGIVLYFGQTEESFGNIETRISTPLTVTTQRPHPAPVPVSVSASEREVFTLVNEYRNSRGLPSLVLDARLMQAARNHNNLMAQRNILSHQLPNELPLADSRTCNDRLNLVGYVWGSAAENIASG